MRFSLMLMLTTAILGGLVAGIAVADHHRTRARIDRADLAGWFCVYRGTRCDQQQPGPIHARWTNRELAYKSFEGAAAFVFALGAVSLVRVRRPATP